MRQRTLHQLRLTAMALLLIAAFACGSHALAQLSVPNPLEGVDTTSPLFGLKDLPELPNQPDPFKTRIVARIVGTIIKGALAVLGSLTVLVLFYGGFLWVTNAGEEEKIKRGKQTVIWAALGVAMIFGSFAAVDAIIGIVAVGAGQQAVNQAPEALLPRTPCEDAGNKCVVLSECIGPASIPSCAREYANENTAISDNTGGLAETLVYVPELSCGTDWHAACMKTVKSTSTSLIPGDLKCKGYPDTEYYCRPCQMVNADGSLTDGFCNRERACEKGIPDPLKHPLCTGDSLKYLIKGTGDCAEREIGATCNLTTTILGYCGPDGSCVNPCSGKSAGDVCTYPDNTRQGRCESAGGSCVLQ